MIVNKEQVEIFNKKIKEDGYTTCGIFPFLNKKGKATEFLTVSKLPYTIAVDGKVSKEIGESYEFKEGLTISVVKDKIVQKDYTF